MSSGEPKIVISGETTMKETLRMVSPMPSLTPQSDDFLDVAGIFKSIFPDLSENCLGEKREQLLEQAERYDKHKHVDKKKSEKKKTKEQTMLEEDVDNDEEWRREMLNYLRQASSDYIEHESHLTRAEQYIVEARGRAAASEKRSRPNRLTPIQQSVLPEFFDEKALCDDHLPSSLLLPSHFFPPTSPYEEPMAKASPRYREPTVNSKSNTTNSERKQQRQHHSDTESRLSSEYRPSPKKLTRPKASTKATAITEPNVTCRGLSRSDDDEHRRLANQVKKMQQEQFDFLKNPRSEAPTRDDLFVADPPEIYFRQWEVGQVMETILEVRNQDKVTRTCTVHPPENPRFHLGLGRYPSKDGRIGSGLSVSYRIQFMPDSLADDETCVEVRHQAGSFKIPVRAIRDKPVLALPDPIDVGCCLMNGKSDVTVSISNTGGIGRFCLVREEEWPSANFRHSVPSQTTTIGPFSITPSMFELPTGGARDLLVNFQPEGSGVFTEKLLLTCDNCQTKEIFITGLAEEVEMTVEVNGTPPSIGQLFDPFATNRVQFESVTPRATSTTTFELANNCHLPLSFGLVLKRPELVAYVDEDTGRTHRIEDNISPFFANIPTGLVQARGRLQVELTFAPEDVGDFHSVFEVVVLDTPGKSRVLAGQVEVVGSCVPIVGSLLPPVFDIPGEIPAGSRLKRLFQIMNMSQGDLHFQWDVDGGPCSIEPSFGVIPGRQMAPLQLCIEAEIPGKLDRKLTCFIDNGQAIDLHVKGLVKPPSVKLNCDKLPFGIVEVGHQKELSFTIDNRNPLPSMWTVELDHPDIRTDVRSGILQPLEEVEIKVVWAPTEEYSLEGLTLTLASAKRVSLMFFGKSVKPEVHFTSTKCDLGEIYVGVPAKFTVELENFSLVPAKFQLIPKMYLPSVPEGVEFVFSMTSGELQPLSRKEIAVEITGTIATSFKDFILACEIFNSRSPTFIECVGHVSDLTVQTWTSYSSENLKMRFDIGKLAGQKIFVKNLTAIRSTVKVIPKLMKGRHPKIRLRTAEFDFIPVEEKGKYQLIRKGTATMATESSLTYREFGKELHKGSKFGASIIANPSSCELGPFETKQIDIIASGYSWGTYKDIIIVQVGELKPIEIAITATIDDVPITVPSTILRFGKMPIGGAPVNKITPITNKANHPITVRFYTLSAFDYADFKSTGVIPGQLSDEDQQFENDPSPWPVRRQRVNFHVPDRLDFKPNETLSLPVEFRQWESENSGEKSAYIVGLLNLPFDKRGDGENFYRKTGTVGPAFEFRLHAMLDWKSFQLELVEATEFIENVADIINNNYEKEKKFSIFNTSGMVASLTLSIDPPFKINENMSTTTITLKPNTREVLSVTIDLPREVIYQQKPTDLFTFDPIGHIMKTSGVLKTVGLKENQEVNCKAQISYPIVKVSKTEFDFGTCFLNDIFKLDLCIDNVSTSATPFVFIPLFESNFSITPMEGTLGARQVITLEIAFSSDCEIDYVGAFELHLSNRVIQISCKGAGTLDSAYCNRFS